MKNIIFLLIGGCYFLFYFFGKPQWHEIFTQYSIVQNTIPFLNALFAWFLAWSIVWFIGDFVLKLYNKWVSKKEFLYKILVGELIWQFFRSAKYIVTLYVVFQILILPEQTQIPAKLEALIDTLFGVSLIVIFLLLIQSLIQSVFKQIQTQRADPMAKQIFPIIKNFIVVFLWVVWWITIVWNLWYDITALITWAGIWWLALALASQKTVANMFGAVSVIVNRPFRIGDTIAIGTNKWVVSDIWLTYLKLKTENNTEILIPNETIISSTVEKITESKKS